MLAFLVVGAADARATLRIENHNVPAGDPTPITYRLNSSTWTAPIDFVLKEGEERSFGPNAGTYTVHALLPAGWAVQSILCASSHDHPATDGEVVTDVSAGIATFFHGPEQHQTCSFTNGKARTGPPSPLEYGSSRACKCRWAPYVRDHGPGQGQLPVSTIKAPGYRIPDARGSTRPGPI